MLLVNQRLELGKTCPAACDRAHASLTSSGTSEQARTVVYGTVKLPSIEPPPTPNKGFWSEMPSVISKEKNAVIGRKGFENHVHEASVLAFALGCVLSSVYGFASGAWPFGVVELIWAGVAVRRYQQPIAA
jgi:hypothetical protein